MSFTGNVQAIYIAAEGAAPMRAVEEIKAIAGVGLDGDRYATGLGTFSDKDRPHGQVTLIEAEALVGATLETGLPVEAADTRRNIVTAGVPLNHLVGRRFRVGEAVFEGVKLCEPCSHIERLSGKELRKPLLHRGGLNAVIVDGGRIAHGDVVAPLPA